MKIALQIAKLIFFPLYKLLFWVKVEGKKNIPKQGGYIICCNHVSVWDPVIMIFSFKRAIHMMGKAELFSNIFLKAFFTLFCVFQVKRGTGDRKSLDYAVDLVNKGEFVGIFPEGKRSKDGKPLKAKSGIALISNITKCDILPCAVVYNGKPRMFRRAKFIIGEMIPYEKIAFDEINRTNLRKTSDYIMDRIVELN